MHMYVCAYLNKTQVTRDRPAHACNFLVELYMQVAAGHLVIVLPIESSSGRPCRKLKYTQEQQGRPSFPLLEQPQEHAYRLDHTTSTSGIKAHNNKESSAARPNFSF